MQVYVLVTDVHPLTVYLYTDGLARFCTDLYEAPDEDNLDMREMHLTNFSINWESEAFEPGLLSPTPLLSLLSYTVIVYIVSHRYTYVAILDLDRCAQGSSLLATIDVISEQTKNLPLYISISMP